MEIDESLPDRWMGTVEEQAEMQCTIAAHTKQVTNFDEADPNGFR